MKSLDELIRPNVARMAPYSCARNEFEGVASVCLDANENPYNSPYNRYPDPLQRELKRRIAQIKGVAPDRIFLGNGSDESIDLAFRAFCEPGIDNVVAIEPTYGMYKVCAELNQVEYRPVLLDEHFSFQADWLLSACDEHTKLIFVCSPNNPTGNSMPREEIFRLLDSFEGLVIVDEAYIDFSAQESLLKHLNDYPNLLVFQTLSKAWGCAGLRLGLAYADPAIVEIYNKIKYPYNINVLTQQTALNLIQDESRVKEWVGILLAERERMRQNLAQLSMVQAIYPSDANFLLVKVTDADAIYRYLVEQSIIVRNRNRVRLCGNCLRITVGTPEENAELLRALQNSTL